jgi:hypothetical protein
VSSGVLVAVALLIAPAAAKTAHAASALIYDYKFKGTTGTVANSAPGGPVASLKLIGTWKNTTNGVNFSGNTTGNESVAYGRPATGYTLSASASQAVGFGVKIVYKAPAGATCFADTPNVTQIGKYPAAQVKIQESSCATSKDKVLLQCRFAGSKSASKVPSVTNKMPLVNGTTYAASCMKSPDSTAGTASVTFSVTNLKTSNTLTNHFSVSATGAIRSTEYISVANKYPLPRPASNVDQFNGGVNSTVYCVGTVAAVTSCLSTSL